MHYPECRCFFHTNRQNDSRYLQSGAILVPTQFATSEFPKRLMQVSNFLRNSHL
jgi:hypothetical protein